MGKLNSIDPKHVRHGSESTGAKDQQSEQRKWIICSYAKHSRIHRYELVAGDWHDSEFTNITSTKE